MKRSHSKYRGHNGNHFWQSYSDIIASFLLVFVLVLSGTILQLHEAYEALIEETGYTVESTGATSSSDPTPEEPFDPKAELETILGIRQSLIDALRKQFTEDDLYIDPNTGAIVFKADLMFDFESSHLNGEYRSALRPLLQKYLGVLLSDEFAPYVAEILIVGHTDSIGEYNQNLWLSQQRALSVANFILAEHEQLFSNIDPDYLCQIISVSGRSESDLILDENGKEDQAASRRVEIQFRLKDQEMIEKLIAAIS